MAKRTRELLLMGKNGCATLHAGSKEMVAALRLIADTIEARG
jgi:hypothetical protein